MKRLAGVAVMVAWFCCCAFAQRGGGHGGFSGSAPGGGFAGRGGPMFGGGFRNGFRPSGLMGPGRFGPGWPSYPFRGYNGRFRNRAFFGRYPYGWGYPYLWPGFYDDSWDNWDNWDNYDSQQAANYAPPQPHYYGDDPYRYEPRPDQYQRGPEDPDDSGHDSAQEPAPSEEYLQPPSSSRRAPHKGAQAAPSAPGAVTLVFKDGRPSEYVYNYVMTAKTLTVLDEPRRVIPLARIDLEASAIASAQNGVEFSGPVPAL